jgi:hypothetical protein
LIKNTYNRQSLSPRFAQSVRSMAALARRGCCAHRGLAQFERKVTVDKTQVEAMSKLLVPEVGLDAELRRIIMLMLHQDHA